MWASVLPDAIRVNSAHRQNAGVRELGPATRSCCAAGLQSGLPGLGATDIGCTTMGGQVMRTHKRRRYKMLLRCCMHVL